MASNQLTEGDVIASTVSSDTPAAAPVASSVAGNGEFFSRAPLSVGYALRKKEAAMPDTSTNTANAATTCAAFSSPTPRAVGKPETETVFVSAGAPPIGLIEPSIASSSSVASLDPALLRQDGSTGQNPTEKIVSSQRTKAASSPARKESRKMIDATVTAATAAGDTDNRASEGNGAGEIFVEAGAPAPVLANKKPLATTLPPGTFAARFRDDVPAWEIRAGEILFFAPGQQPEDGDICRVIEKATGNKGTTRFDTRDRRFVDGDGWRYDEDALAVEGVEVGRLLLFSDVFDARLRRKEEIAKE